MQCPKCHYTRTTHDKNPAWQCPSCGIAYKKYKALGGNLKKIYVPNVIPAGDRNINFGVSVLLFLYGTTGLYYNDIYLPAKRGPGLHFHDTAAWFLYSAIICSCFVMMSVIIDHYDKRDNERMYKMFSTVFKYGGYGFFVVAIFYGVVFHQANK